MTDMQGAITLYIICDSPPKNQSHLSKQKIEI